MIKTAFDITVHTQYAEQEVFEFLVLTGLKPADGFEVLKHLNEVGIHRLYEINRLVQLGQLEFHKNDKTIKL